MLAACSGPEAAAPAAPASTDPAGRRPHLRLPLRTIPPLTRDETGMHIDCQGTRLHLAAQPTQDTDASRLTTLEIEKDGARQAIAAPRRWTAIPPLAWPACRTAAVRRTSSQYGELPFGCSFCEWYYLYDASGRQLTQAQRGRRGAGAQQRRVREVDRLARHHAPGGELHRRLSAAAGRRTRVNAAPQYRSTAVPEVPGAVPLKEIPFS